MLGRLQPQGFRQGVKRSDPAQRPHHHHIGNPAAGVSYLKDLGKDIDLDQPVPPGGVHLPGLLFAAGQSLQPRCVRWPRDQYAKVIRNGLGRVGCLLGADRCIFYSVARDRRQFKFDPAFIGWPEEDNEDIKVLDEYREKHPDFFGNFQFALDRRNRLIGVIFANGLMRKRNEEEIQQALSEIKQLNEQIEAD